MKAKDFLEQIEKLDTMIQCKKAESHMWRDIAYGVTSGGDSVWVEHNGKKELHNMEKVQTSSDKQTMANAIHNYLDIDDELPEDIKRLQAARREIISVIERLKPKFYKFLHMVYVQRLDLETVAIKHDRSYSWATTMHGICLKKVQQILDAEHISGPKV